MSELKQRCATCAVREACKYTFGKYWSDKSGMGEGCNVPIDADRADAILAAKLRAETEENRERPRERIVTASERRRETWHKYIVTHKGREYPTAAPSDKAAVNFVRFNVYGSVPTWQCGKFDVRMAESESAPATPQGVATVPGATPHKIALLAERMKRFAS